MAVHRRRRHHQDAHQHYHRGDHLRACWLPAARHLACSRPVECLPVYQLPAGFQDDALLKAAVRDDEPQAGDAVGGASRASQKARPNRSLGAIHSRTSTSRVRASRPNTSSNGVHPKRTERLRRVA